MSESLLSTAIRLPDAPGALVEHLCGLSATQVCERLATGGVMLLRTCERFEVYVSSRASEPTDAAALVEAMLADAGMACAETRDFVRIRRSGPAAEHLLRVSAGLDSRIVGEPQITGQIRRAYLAAQEAGSLDALLFALGRAAIHTGRRVARETTLQASCRGLAERVAEFATRGDRGAAPRVGLIGSGHLAGELAQALAAVGAGPVAVCTGREPPRPAPVPHGARWCREDLPELLRRCDVVIACTSRANVLDERSAAAGARRAGPLVVIDLGMPRNVAPGVGRLAGVSLHTLNDFLDPAADRANSLGVRAAERIVAEELQRFEVWRAARRRRASREVLAA